MKIILFALSILLTGCSTFKTIETHIPVIAKRPTVIYPSFQKLPIMDLNASSAPSNVIKAYVSSVVILKRDNESLRTILESQN